MQYCSYTALRFVYSLWIKWTVSSVSNNHFLISSFASTQRHKVFRDRLQVGHYHTFSIFTPINGSNGKTWETQSNRPVVVWASSKQLSLRIEKCWRLIGVFQSLTHERTRSEWYIFGILSHEPFTPDRLPYSINQYHNPPGSMYGVPLVTKTLRTYGNIIGTRRTKYFSLTFGPSVCVCPSV